MGKEAEQKKDSPEEIEEKDPGQKGPKTEAPEEKSGQQGPTIEEVLGPLDDALGSHIERLLGTRHGIETLPMNLFNVSCLIMVATRETEIESFPYLPPSRYTHENLLEELAEISIYPGLDLESGIQVMIEKGYIEVADDGRFFARRPTIDMAQLLDRIFPNMPGLNLVAYLGQIIDEALGGRKDIDNALNQLNQMLEMQGVPIKSETAASKPKAKQFPHLKEAVKVKSPSEQKASSQKITPSDIFSKLETKIWASPPQKAKKSASASDTVRDDMAPTAEVEEFSPVEEMNAATADQGVESQEQGVQGEDAREEQVLESIGDSTDEVATPPETSQDPASGEPGLEAGDLSSREGQITTTEHGEKDDSPVPDFSDLDDEDIEKRIAAFEEKLGMTCPLCKSSGIRSKETAKGKLYYHCTNTDCNFISWGKPYYIACPQCSNPFLVEAQDSSGRTMLKCPRATCHHWQQPPWEMPDETSEDVQQSSESTSAPKKPRKKVRRRRRVVRRKR